MRMHRIGISVLLAAGLLVAPATLTGASESAPADSEVSSGATEIAAEEVLAMQVTAAVTTQVYGGDAAPSDFLVQQVGDTLIAIPPGAVLTDLRRSNGYTGTSFVVSSPDGALGGSAAMAAGWVSDNSACATTENSTGWMDYCWLINHWSEQKSLNGGLKWIYTLNHEATHKSKSVWTMYKARIRAVPNVTMYWADWDPAADADHGNCKSGSLGVSYAGVGLTVNTEKCDKWDIGKFSEGGRFDNTWFGSAWRSERHVEYLIEVGRTSKSVSWTVHNDFWAN